jgi:hypothetical protein
MPASIRHQTKTRLNPHGLFAIALLIVAWLTWYEWPKPENLNPPSTTTVAKPPIQASAVAPPAHDPPVSSPDEGGSTKSQRSIQIAYGWYLFCASAVYVLLVIFSARDIDAKDSAAEDSAAKHVVTNGAANADDAGPASRGTASPGNNIVDARIARHRVAFGGHIFMMLACLAWSIRENVQSDDPNDYYVLSFVVALSLGVAAPFLIWRTTRYPDPETKSELAG